MDADTDGFVYIRRGFREFVSHKRVTVFLCCVSLMFLLLARRFVMIDSLYEIYVLTQREEP